MLMNMVWIDYVIIGVIALSLLSGFIRGFFREFLSFIVWVAAFLITFNYYPLAIKYITFFNEELLQTLSAIAILFIGVLFIGTILVQIICRFVNFSGFSGTDRILGILFGFLRGVVIVSILIFIAKTFSSLATTDEWQQSQLIPYFHNVVDWGVNYFQVRYDVN